MSFGYFGRETQNARNRESACIATPPSIQIYFCQQVWGISPGVHQCKANGYVWRAHCRIPVAIDYHAPQAQPCLPDVEICIGLMLVADLVRACVCGAHPNLSVLPRIIQLPCLIAEPRARIYFTTRSLGLSRFVLDFLRCGAVHTGEVKALAIFWN